MLNVAVECNENCWNIYWEICGILKLTCRTRIFKLNSFNVITKLWKISAFFQIGRKSLWFLFSFLFICAFFFLHNHEKLFWHFINLFSAWKYQRHENLIISFIFVFVSMAFFHHSLYQVESISIENFLGMFIFFIASKTRRLWKKCRRCEGKLSFLFSYKLFSIKK